LPVKRKADAFLREDAVKSAIADAKPYFKFTTNGRVSMKTLIVNGSPRKNGYTSKLSARLIELLDGEKTVIETYRSGASPCIDCRYCWTHDKCALQDPMQESYREINEADNIVLASPIHFAELTGSLLGWASRLQYFWVSKYIRKQVALQRKERYGALILVDGSFGYKDIALATGTRLLHAMGAGYKGLVYYTGTDKLGSRSPLEDEATRRSLEELADVLNRKGG
jgi:putative NADPH-quinone reductase